MMQLLTTIVIFIIIAIIGTIFFMNLWNPH